MRLYTLPIKRQTIIVDYFIVLYANTNESGDNNDNVPNIDHHKLDPEDGRRTEELKSFVEKCHNIFLIDNSKIQFSNCQLRET